MGEHMNVYVLCMISLCVRAVYMFLYVHVGVVCYIELWLKCGYKTMTLSLSYIHL